MKLFKPNEIPLSYFYFGYKKAKFYITREAGICDYLDLHSFELDLEKNIKSIKADFETGNYELSEAIFYWSPKSWDSNKNPRLRPKVMFKLRDQIAWATVILALGEWFDTNPKMKERIPLKDREERRNFEWMVPWSFNNRIKRIHKYDEIIEDYQESFIHFNGASLYESFQWGLHQMNSYLHKNIKECLQKHKNVYLGKADIQEFYPSLEMKRTIKVIIDRLKALEKANVFKGAKDWEDLLTKLSQFHFEFPDFNEVVYKQVLEDYGVKLGLQDDADERAVKDKLKESLPLDLIASGFLSNCVLTQFVDLRLTEYIKEQKKEGVNLFITRYTDDFNIVSSNQDVVGQTIKKIEEYLDDVGVKLSKDKVTPRNRDEYKNQLLEKSEIRQLLLGKSDEEQEIILDVIINNSKIDFEPEKISQADNIPGSTAVIEKMSQFAHEDLHAMDNKELESFIIELLKLLGTKFDENEIKDETKVTFASWRIRKGLKEAMQRSLSMGKYKISQYFEKTIRQYPYKVQLYEIYFYYLIDELTMSRNWKHTLTCLRKYLVELKFVDVECYGPFIRSKLLFTLAMEWKRIPLDYRTQLKQLVIDVIQKWYEENIASWHEKYAIYWCFSVLKIRQDPKLAVYYDDYPATNDLLARLFKTYKLGTFYYYELEEQKKNQGNEQDIDPTDFDGSILYILNRIFLKGLFYNKKKRKAVFSPFELSWYQSVWNLLRKFNSIDDPILVRIWCLWVQIDYEKVTKDGFELLHIYKKYFTDQEKRRNNNIFFIEVVSVLNQLLKKWLENPKQYSIFNKWFKGLKDNDKDSPLLKVIYDRFLNITIIQEEFLKESDCAFKTPISISNLTEYDSKKLVDLFIPLHDWLFFIQNIKQNEINFLRPMTEYEIVYIFNHILEKHLSVNQLTDSRDINRNFLFHLGFSIKTWKLFRESIMNDRYYNKEDFPKSTETVEEPLLMTNINLLSELQYPAISILLSETIGEDIDSRVGKDPAMNYLRSITLLSMLVGNGINKALLQPFYLYNWKDLQRFLSLIHFPSTTLSSILVNTLNYHRKFYENFYDASDEATLPYRKLGNQPVDSYQSYKKIIVQHIAQLEENLLEWNFGFIEVLEVDIDMITKDGIKG